MLTTDSSNNSTTYYIGTLLDDLLTWRTISNKQLGNKKFSFQI